MKISLFYTKELPFQTTSSEIGSPVRTVTVITKTNYYTEVILVLLPCVAVNTLQERPLQTRLIVSLLSPLRSYTPYYLL